MIYGYARVSTQDQNLDTQLEKLGKYGVDEILHEKITGIAKEKPQLETLLERLNDGDTLVVTRMDRLGRSTIQLLGLIETLSTRNVHLVIMDLGIDTRTPTGKFFLTVMAAFSELERSVIKIKQRDGIRLAKARGVYQGRPKRYTEKHSGINHAIELFKQRDQNGYTVNQICEITQIGRSSLYRMINERYEELFPNGIGGV